jgi:hypothetical protein
MEDGGLRLCHCLCLSAAGFSSQGNFLLVLRTQIFFRPIYDVFCTQKGFLDSFEGCALWFCLNREEDVENTC